MSDVLRQIIEGVKEDERSRRVSAAEMNERIASAPIPIDALESLRREKFSVIAEVKRSSPSKGALAKIEAPEKLAEIYAANGAATISVLTEQRRFNGSLQDLRRVREAVAIPILRKDFMVSEFLIQESRAAGADMVLLIVAALDDVELKDFFQLASELGMRSLIEIHDEAELERAMSIEPEIIGVNSRNLKTLEVNAQVFSEIIPRIPSSIYRVAESGISGTSDVKFAVQSGADAILVGESLVRSNDSGSTLREFLEVATSIN